MQPYKIGLAVVEKWTNRQTGGLTDAGDHITSLVDLIKITTAQHNDKLPYSRLAINLINCRLDS